MAPFFLLDKISPLQKKGLLSFNAAGKPQIETAPVLCSHMIEGLVSDRSCCSLIRDPTHLAQDILHMPHALQPGHRSDCPCEREREGGEGGHAPAAGISPKMDGVIVREGRQRKRILFILRAAASAHRDALPRGKLGASVIFYECTHTGLAAARGALCTRGDSVLFVSVAAPPRKMTLPAP
ncbi:hypothetical protein WMY93_007097 [Mugilogobius chulae]|uniref:Uncharacterized protein n=1 Tax=Mugilogobius chulae TaxID=88201 RepID=A0AAW0PP89_9GOBI